MANAQNVSLRISLIHMINSVDEKKRLKNTFWSANSCDTLFLYLLVSKAGLSIQVHNNCYICCDGTGGDCQTLPGICWKSSGKGRLRHLIFLFKICWIDCSLTRKNWWWCMKKEHSTFIKALRFVDKWHRCKN